MRTSYSALETFKICPLKYKFSQIDKIKGEKSKEAVFGSVIHSALRFMFTKNPLFPTIDEVLNYFSDIWSGESLTLKIPENQTDSYLEEGKKILRKFFLKNQPWNFNIVDLESRFEVIIEDPNQKESHILAGIIDRVDKPTDDTYEIIDYKTSRRMPSQDFVDKNLQLSIYNLGLVKRWTHISPDQVTLSLYFLEHGEKLSSKRSSDDLASTKNQILLAIKDIRERERSSEFPPTPGPWCGFCPYRPICPMWKHLYKKEDAPSDEEIKSIIRDYFEAKNSVLGQYDKIEMLQAKIHHYLDEKGLERIFGPDGYITRRTAEKKNYDLERARVMLQPLGLWQEVLKVDEKKLEKILKTLPEQKQKKFDGIVKDIKKVSTLTISRKRLQIEKDL